MSTASPSTLQSFHNFLGRQLASPAGESMSPEEALARWRDEEETIAAIREGLADVEAGRVYPVEDVLRDLREEFRLP